MLVHGMKRVYFYCAMSHLLSDRLSVELESNLQLEIREVFNIYSSVDWPPKVLRLYIYAREIT